MRARSRCKVLAAVQGGAHTRPGIAQAAGLEIGYTSELLKELEAAGRVETRGRSRARRWYAVLFNFAGHGTSSDGERPNAVA